MLTFYRPMPGGISAYAEQLVTRLRQDGHDVLVASPLPSDAQLTLDICEPGAGLRLARIARRSELLVVQFHPELLGEPGTPRSARALAFLRLAVGLAAARRSELCLHEVVYGHGGIDRAIRAVVRHVFRMADTLTVHTEREKADLVASYRVDPDRVRVVSQGASMIRHTDTDQAGARASLGIPSDGHLFLSIGFLHPRKGFDRAIRSFGMLGSPSARLYVVGSAWREDEITTAHIDELRLLIAATPGAELRLGHVSDEAFDAWIVAADTILLPYREGWSSNVMERGILYHRPVIVSNVGGMGEQGTDRPGVTLVDDDQALLDALRLSVTERRVRA